MTEKPSGVETETPLPGSYPPRLTPSAYARPDFIARTAAIAGVYAALTLALQPISYGPLQVRVAEALTVLPYLAAPAVPGLFLGCLLANLLGGFGWQDVVFGSAATLLAALVTRWIGARRLSPALAPLPPVVLNALIVPAYLHLIFNLPYALTAAQILIGQTVACYGVGYPLLSLLMRRPDLADRLQ